MIWAVKLPKSSPQCSYTGLTLFYSTGRRRQTYSLPQADKSKGKFIKNFWLTKSLTSFSNPCIIQPALSQQAMLGLYLVSLFPNFPAQLPMQSRRDLPPGFGQTASGVVK